MSPSEKSRLVKDLARQLGFDRTGIATAGAAPRADYVAEWLANGRAGTMDYLKRHDAVRRDPRLMLEGARSIIVTALNYRQEAPPAADNGPRGRVAMYAWGRDYHLVLREKLAALESALREALQEPFATRMCVDTAPLLEREWAAAAGVGWIGKNTLVLHADLGSFFFLGELLTTLDLAPDTPVADHCGSCTRCLEACPTQAFPAPYEMDASRCVSYLTIEHRGEIPAELRAGIGDWLFGCDVCQEVCPFNRKAPVAREADFAPQPPGATPLLDEILNWTPQQYAATLRQSAMKRAKLDMFKRNAAIALENISRPGQP